jgi:hypothetical protein
MLAVVVAIIFFGFASETSDAWKTPVAPEPCDVVFYTEVQGVEKTELFEYGFHNAPSEFVMHCELSLVPFHQE